MKIKLAIGYFLFVSSILGILFTIYIAIFETEGMSSSELFSFVGIITLLLLIIYYSYYTSIASNKTPLTELDAEIYIIKKKIENKRLLRKLEELESENEDKQ